MIFEKYLLPDVMAESFNNITPEAVRAAGASVLISDIDNTLVTYDDPKPTAEVLRWLEDMKRGGVTVAFLSNNHAERVSTFASGTELIAIPDGKKPSCSGIDDILSRLGKSRSDAALLGDQLLTDCLTAKRAGLPAFIVPPIKDKTSLFFKAKRLLEKPYVKKYRRIHAGEKPVGRNTW